MSDTAAAELLQHTDPALLGALRALGDQYGPLGVALTAAALTEPEALVARLRTAGLLDADGVTLGWRELAEQHSTSAQQWAGLAGRQAATLDAVHGLLARADAEEDCLGIEPEDLRDALGVGRG